MIFSSTKFHQILFRGFRGFALTNCFIYIIFKFGRISRGVTSKKWNQKFLWKCTSYGLHSYKISQNSLSCADKKQKNKKKNMTDGLTDGRVNNIIVAWGIIKFNIKLHLCHDFFYVSHAIGYVRCVPRSRRYRSTCTYIGQHSCSAYLSMRRMKTVVSGSSFVAHLGRYA